MEVRDTSGSWKPEASANTYAHIESKLRENNYDMQVLVNERILTSAWKKNEWLNESIKLCFSFSGINAFKNCIPR